MLNHLRLKAATGLRVLLKSRAARRFARNQNAIAAVEFAFIAAPFFGLLFAILETGLVFFAQETLESGVAEASRLIMTGQAQTNPKFDENAFKNAICAQTFLVNCSTSVFVTVQTYKDFASTSTTPPVTNGKLDTDNPKFVLGGPGDIVVAQAFYQWPVIVPLLDNLADLNGNHRLLVATSAFRNEPYN